MTVIDYYKKGHSDREIEALTGVSKSSCNVWKHLYLDNYKNLIIKYNKEKKNNEEIFLQNIGDEIFQFIEKLVSDNPFFSYTYFINAIEHKFKIKLNNRKMKLIFGRLKLTKKRIRQRVIKSKEFLEEIIKNRKNFIEIINKELVHNIISIDETGFNKLINGNTKGYSKVGEEINIPINELKMKNTSMLVALSTSGIVNNECFMINIDSDIYLGFIKNTIDNLKKKNPLLIYTFIFDNVSFHNDKRIIDLIIENNYKYFFVPSYSPNLNPVENVFSILKQDINKEILNNFVNKDLFNNYKQINEDCRMESKKNKKIIIDRKNETIKQFKNIAKDCYKLKLIYVVGCIKKNIKYDALAKKRAIRNYKVCVKKNKIVVLKKIIDEINIIFLDQIKNEKNKKYNIFKKFITDAVIKFNKNYDQDRITKIFKHAFTFNHDNIERELRDRIKIKDVK